ncbi:hypothetical protein AVEN_95591-1 [Araneus ventricosus]|uniref:Integrase zinc-binding domain-containing protein n=1 Tax=Araneus ventricosus TaxID=182803 RepID=A0A4Y2FZ46_ARAVE|nr:hypothetical protein AVEN_95591-1 [Araneus ventricosus]
MQLVKRLPAGIFQNTHAEMPAQVSSSSSDHGSKFPVPSQNSPRVATNRDDGVLYRRWESDDGESCRWQLILPKSRILEVLRETHDSASGGHFGVMKTLSKTRERFYWDRLRADVEKWCRECHACGARKGPKTRTKGRLQRYNVGRIEIS